MRLFWFVILSLVFFFGIIFYYGYQVAYKAVIPRHSGEMSSPFISNSVNVSFDDYGVPSIEAKTREDLYFALGYIHASERLWQMTLSQLSIEGRFAEFFGEEVLPYDRLLRTVGFRRTAQQIVASMPEQERTWLEAYANGVNQFVSKNGHRLPFEFALADMEPLQWEPFHSVGIARLMAWQLNVTWWPEATLASLFPELSREKQDELRQMFELPAQQFAINNRTLTGQALDFLDLEMNMRSFMNAWGTHVGSNAWAVDSSRTQTGTPLLAGDPHLGISSPSIWYEVNLSTPEFYISGATIAGAPIVLLGQNEYFAWSLTNIMADDTDFFIEKFAATDSNLVLQSMENDRPKWDTIRVEHEYITVKGGTKMVHTNRFTQNGVLIDQIYPEPVLDDSLRLSMAWVGSQISDELGVFFKINAAKNLEEVRAALPGFVVPGQHLIYADKTGNIARFSLAKLPKRSIDTPLFKRGWIKEERWTQWIGFDDLPHTINPREGYVMSSNTGFPFRDFSGYVSRYWESASRRNRIKAYLDTVSVANPELFAQMQNDTYSDFARRFTEKTLPVLQTLNSDSLTNSILPYLENWDFTYTPLSTAASITDFFLQELTRMIFQDELGKERYKTFIRLENIPVRAITWILENPLSAFVDNINTNEKESLDELINTAMNVAVRKLLIQYGDQPFQWRWEKHHTLTLEPPLFKEVAEAEEAPAIFKLIYKQFLIRGPYSVGGHGMSVNNGQYNWEKPYAMTLGPSIRRIVNFSDSTVKSILPGGQSGVQNSPFFDDQIHGWLNGQYKSGRTYFESSSPTLIFNPQK